MRLVMTEDGIRHCLTRSQIPSQVCPELTVTAHIAPGKLNINVMQQSGQSRRERKAQQRGRDAGAGSRAHHFPGATLSEAVRGRSTALCQEYHTRPTCPPIATLVYLQDLRNPPAQLAPPAGWKMTLRAHTT